MKLTIKDRLVLGGILLKKSSLHKMKLCTDIAKKVEFTADEIKDSGMELVAGDDGRQRTTFKENTETEIEFTKDEESLLKESAKLCNDNEEVTADNIDLIMKLT